MSEAKHSENSKLTLQERVRRFNLGTPVPMHVGTHELVNELWEELERMQAKQSHAPSASLTAAASGEGNAGDLRAVPAPGSWDPEGPAVYALNKFGQRTGIILRAMGKHRRLGELVDAARLAAAAPDMRAAGTRLLPAAGFITDATPDDEQINLVTTVGAVRQLASAISAAVGDRPADATNSTGAE